MWQSHNTTIPIPPNLLRNFNTFDILEPQRNGAENRDVAKVEKLVDIDDSSQDSGFHEFESLLLNKKKDLTLIDVYENIYLTPQDIKVKSEEEESTSLPSKPNVDFKELFDIIESGKKYDWVKPSSSKEKTTFKPDDHEDIVKPRVLLPPVIHETNLDPDEFIYEVLSQKDINKHILNETKFQSNIRSSSDVKHSVLTADDRRRMLNNFTKNTNDNMNKHEIKQSETSIKRINNNNFIVKAIKKEEKVYKKKHIVKPESQTSKFTKGPDFYEKSVVLPQIMARMFDRKECLDEKNNIQRRLVLDSGANKLQAQPNISKTEKELKNSAPPMRNDINVGLKYQPNGLKTETEFKNDAQPVRSVVNVGLRVKKTDSAKLTDAIILSANRSSCTPAKTVIDLSNNETNSKITKDTDYGKLSPVVLMEDCNKERLKAWQRSQLFKNFVNKGKFEL